jgi:predicted Zn-dependent protease
MISGCQLRSQLPRLEITLIRPAGYAADGLRNVMVTLKQQEKSSPPSWLSAHPLTNERIPYLENLIERECYNRYAYEGVARHAEIKA